MSEISLKRVKNLLKLQTAGGKYSDTKWRIPFFFIVFAVGGMFLALLHFAMVPSSFVIPFSTMCMIFSFNFFNVLNTEKGREIAFLVFPASTKEKIIAHLIYAISFSTIICAFTFSGMVLLQGWVNLRAGQDFLSYMPILKALTLATFFAGLLAQAFFCFFALVYRKWILIKTLLFGFFLLCMIIAAVVLVKDLEINIKRIVGNGILLLSIVLFWVANYYKLKNREI
jgi:hypothetical protein